MARSLPIVGESSPLTPSPRKEQVRLGVWIELVTIVWMTIEASIAITVGFATRSVSLQGFGMDSIVELIASGILLWRLLVEQRGGSVERIELAEPRASYYAAFPNFHVERESELADLWSCANGSSVRGNGDISFASTQDHEDDTHRCTLGEECRGLEAVPGLTFLLSGVFFFPIS